MGKAIDIRVLSSLSSIEASAWDRLVGENDPFVEHRFLSVLEESATVGTGTGWEPCHVTAWRDGELVAALPLYLKTHSYGEYIFDWSWAEAAERLGSRYYPKLVAMVPVTPVTGRRFLFAPGEEPAKIVSRLIDGCMEAAEANRASSVHLLFLNPEERDWVSRDGRLMERLSFQFHWTNPGYASFDEFLSEFRSPMRKKLRKERRAASETGLCLQTIAGTELSGDDWQHLQKLYQATCARKGSYPYLTPAFFELAASKLRQSALVCAATQDGRMVAASLNFEKGKHLYGRYWGAAGRYDMLHFELCYYRLIERAIERGMDRFEAGAQGTHKLRRGLMPRPIYSAHWIRHPVLRSAVSEFLPREAQSVQDQIRHLSYHGPFRRDRGMDDMFEPETL